MMKIICGCNKRFGQQSTCAIKFFFSETIMESGYPCHSFDSFAVFELVLQM
jgi:hypothetical protein